MFWIAVGLFLVYYTVGTVLTKRADRYLRDQNRVYLTSKALFEPEMYEARGEVFRRQATTFWYVGGAVVLAAIILIFAAT
jgi:hypothetical protein